MAARRSRRQQSGNAPTAAMAVEVASLAGLIHCELASQCRCLAFFGPHAISELSLLSSVKRKLDLETSKGGFWRKADIGQLGYVG
jgi:hypothetical protein